MKKKMFLFFTIIFIIISICLVVIANSINKDKINKIPMNIENNQTETIEKTEKVNEVSTEVNKEIVEENLEMNEVVDQPQVSEKPKEEKVNNPITQTKQSTQVAQKKNIVAQEPKKKNLKLKLQSQKYQNKRKQKKLNLLNVMVILTE